MAEGGPDYFGECSQRQSSETRARIRRRIDRVELGDFGDPKRVGKGVAELRIDFGPGCRVYCGADGEALAILLAGGTNKRQSRDIGAAQACWRVCQQEKRKCQ